MVIYGFIFIKNWFDNFYIIILVLTTLSWTFYNGECLISYYSKKSKNKNYIAGEDISDLNDMYQNFFSRKFVDSTIYICSFVIIISEIIVLKRNNYNKYICYLFPILQLSYVIFLKIYKKIYQSKILLLINEFFKFSFIVILIFIVKKY